MILLPQVAPADQIYLTPTTQPVAEGRSTDLALNFAKTLTERLGVRFEEDYTWLGGNLTGWQNLEMVTQYLAVLDPAGSIGHGRRRSSVGRHRHATDWGLAQGATTPTIYFAKGMGDFDIGYLRPLAVTGSIGYQLADARAAPRQSA